VVHLLGIKQYTLPVLKPVYKLRKSVKLFSCLTTFTLLRNAGFGPATIPPALIRGWALSLIACS
jgi:hypothetical protein